MLLTRSVLLRGAALAALLLAMPVGVVFADDTPPPPPASGPQAAKLPHFVPKQVVSDGSATVRGQKIDYQAVAGTLVIHPKGWDDSDPDPAAKDSKNPQAEASMFYVAYFKKGVRPENRPITLGVRSGRAGS
jgi:carboxypeptidase C (cathepsin A)